MNSITLGERSRMKIKRRKQDLLYKQLEELGGVIFFSGVLKFKLKAMQQWNPVLSNSSHDED